MEVGEGPVTPTSVGASEGIGSSVRKLVVCFDSTLPVTAPVIFGQLIYFLVDADWLFAYEKEWSQWMD